jgi:hypothetical protein
MMSFVDIPMRLIDLTISYRNLVQPVTEIDCSVHDPNDPFLFEVRAVDYARPSFVVEAIQDNPERHLQPSQRPEA